MAGRREKARLGNARQLRLSHGGGERSRRAPPFGYVFVSVNDAFGLLVTRAVGHDPAHEPVTALSLDFALKGRLTPEDCFGVIQESVVDRKRTEIRERAAQIARNYIEERSRRRGEESDVEARIEEIVATLVL